MESEKRLTKIDTEVNFDIPKDYEVEESEQTEEEEYSEQEDENEIKEIVEYDLEGDNDSNIKILSTLRDKDDLSEKRSEKESTRNINKVPETDLPETTTLNLVHTYPNPTEESVNSKSKQKTKFQNNLLKTYSSNRSKEKNSQLNSVRTNQLGNSYVSNKTAKTFTHKFIPNQKPQKLQMPTNRTGKHVNSDRQHQNVINRINVKSGINTINIDTNKSIAMNINKSDFIDTAKLVDTLNNKPENSNETLRSVKDDNNETLRSVQFNNNETIQSNQINKNQADHSDQGNNNETPRSVQNNNKTAQSVKTNIKDLTINSEASIKEHTNTINKPEAKDVVRSVSASKNTNSNKNENDIKNFNRNDNKNYNKNENDLHEQHNEANQISEHNNYSQSSFYKKTAFTKLSEEAYKNLLKKSNSKVSFYDKMISDQYLKKVTEKNSAASKTKFKSFLERTKEYNTRKSMNQYAQETKKSMSKLNDGLSIKSKNSIHKNIRSPGEYMDDQIKFMERRENDLQTKREIIKMENDKNITSHPLINEKSRSLVKNKSSDSRNVHTKLFEEKTHKIKENILKVTYKAHEEKKMTKKEISETIDKLFNDAKIRNYKKDIYSSLDGMIKVNSDYKSRSNSVTFRTFSQELKFVHKEDYDLSSNASKLIMIKRFVKDFDEAMAVINTSKEPIEFDAYTELLYGLGFSLFDHKSIKMETLINKENRDIDKLNLKSINYAKDNENNEKYDENTLKKIDKEVLIIKDSWKILSKLKNIEDKEIQIDNILIFCFAILGLYKGEENEENLNSQASYNITVNSIQSNSTSQLKPPISVASPRDTKTTVNLIQQVLPNFDLKKFSYQTKVAKQLKMFFKFFYENRMKFLSLRNYETRKSKIIEFNNSATQFTFKPSLTNRSLKSAERFRSKCKMNIKNDSDYFEASGRTRVKMQDVYEIMRKKKQLELAKLRKNQEEAKFSECSFIPKINPQKKNSEKERSRSQQVGARLYSHAMNKLFRIKSIYEERKAVDESFEKDSKECTFSPRILSLNNQIFEENPLINDGTVKVGIERYEKARIEKKLRDLIIFKGYNSMNKIKDLDDLLQEYKCHEELPQFKFENEPLNNRETFDKFQRQSGEFNFNNLSSKNSMYILQKDYIVDSQNLK